jgi:hypothetical protein
MVTDEIEEQLGRSPEDWFHRGIGKPFLPVIVQASHTKPIVLTPANRPSAGQLQALCRDHIRDFKGGTRRHCSASDDRLLGRQLLRVSPFRGPRRARDGRSFTESLCSQIER